MRLTDLTVATLKPGMHWDASLPAFGVRVGKKTRTFLVMKNGHRKSLGHYPALSLSAARKKAHEYFDTLDPFRASQRQISAKDAVSEYLSSRQIRPRTLVEYQRYLGYLPDKKLDFITKQDMRGIITGPHMHRALNTFFTWCVSVDYLPSNPMAGLEPPPKERSRSRTLTDDEIRRIWKACEGRFGDIVKACLLTAQRRGEIACVRPEWLSTTALCIPAHIAKNGREHSIPLTTCAEELLRKLSTSSKPYNTWSKPKKRLDTSSSTNGWTLHDLRRTAATRMAELGVQPHIIERILNHSSGEISGVAAIYNRARYQAEMKEALLRYEAHILSIVAPEG